MSVVHAEKRAWVLRIKDVKESDKGWYMCQINTDPMKSQVGYLDVVGNRKHLYLICVRKKEKKIKLKTDQFDLYGQHSPE
jgi:hypothetical protein